MSISYSFHANTRLLERKIAKDKVDLAITRARKAGKLGEVQICLGGLAIMADIAIDGHARVITAMPINGQGRAHLARR